MATGADFYPRPPRGGRQHRLRHIFRPVEFLSTPSARRATRDFHRASSFRSISIHALREEGDKRQWPRPTARTISIHALREEGDGSSPIKFHARRGFLSTPSARRATKLPPRKRSSQKNFYPRPPRGGRQSGHPALDAGVRISIHALREEGDPKMVGSRKRY